MSKGPEPMPEGPPCSNWLVLCALGGWLILLGLCAFIVELIRWLGGVL